jgi:hypothetical protein
MRAGAPRADDTNAGTALGADDVEDTLLWGHRQRHYPIGMEGIAEVHRMRISQGFRSW